MGTPCPDCGGRGWFAIDVCPHAFAGGGVGEVLQAARIAEKGIWPEAGGLGDQTVWCRNMFDFIWAEQARHRAEAMKGIGDG